LDKTNSSSNLLSDLQNESLGHSPVLAPAAPPGPEHEKIVSICGHDHTYNFTNSALISGSVASTLLLWEIGLPVFGSFQSPH